ncbi:MAG TPA: SpoIIIAH-like family protein [Oscillospiraceae bacterium]|nr:SpoIIIAH-like family protein [Oscillospiraceae bacterium]
MERETSRKVTTIVLLVLALAAVWYAKQFQNDRIDIVDPAKQSETEDPLGQGEPAAEEEPGTGEGENEGDSEGDSEETTAPVVTAPESMGLESYEAYFVEYRLQRDRIRASEVEMFNTMIENPNVSAEAKKEAEAQLLSLIERMEKELMVENMLKAQGFKDAVFFIKDGKAHAVVKAAKLDQTQFMQIAEVVNSVTGLSMDDISVVEHGGS